jgi:hypothetical protein
MNEEGVKALGGNTNQKDMVCPALACWVEKRKEENRA